MKIPPKPANEAQRLQALIESDILDTEPEIDFDDVARLIASICATPIGLVSLVDEHRQWFKARIGFKFSETPRDVAFCAHAILEPDVFVVPDAVADERFNDNPLVIGETNVRFYAGAPITTSEGYNVGEVCVMDTAPRGLTELQRASLRTLARQVATQMEIRRMNSVIKERSRQIDEARLELNDFLDGATDIVLGLRPDGQIVYTNRAWTEAIGYSKAETVGRSIVEIAAPDTHQGFEAMLAGAKAGQSLPSISCDFIAKDGRRLTLEGGISGRRGADGSVESLRGIFRDVTERKVLEQQRQVFEDLATHATDAIMLWHRGADGAFRLRFANAVATAMSPVPLSRVMNSRIEEIFPDLMSPEAHARSGRTLALTQGTTHETSIVINGVPLELRVSLLPLPGSNLGMIIQDIRQRKAVDRIKNEFISTVSHELRTPLTSIRGALGLLEGNVFGPLSEDVMEVVGIARSSTDRLIRLVNDILDIEKLDSGKMELRPVAIQVEKIFNATLAGLHHYARECGVEFESKVEGALAIFADLDRIEQVLTNLISNAVKFSPYGAVVRLRANLTEKGRVRISVQDQGPGITEDNQARLFGRFQQLDATDRRQHGGTGLGLAICKAIIDHHGGTIGLESEIGKGSTFFIELSPPSP